MTKLKLLSAALIAAATLATPAMARESGVASSRHVAADANASTMSGARYFDGRSCVPAPAVGAFATQPWDSAPPCEPTSAY
jgi:hypothetical protein